MYRTTSPNAQVVVYRNAIQKHLCPNPNTYYLAFPQTPSSLPPPPHLRLPHTTSPIPPSNLHIPQIPLPLATPLTHTPPIPQLPHRNPVLHSLRPPLFSLSQKILSPREIDGDDDDGEEQDAHHDAEGGFAT